MQKQKEKKKQNQEKENELCGGVRVAEERKEKLYQV